MESEQHAATSPNEAARAPRSRVTQLLRAPHRRLVMVLSASILLAAAVVGLTLVQIDDARVPVDQLGHRYLRAAESLQATSDALSSITPTFLDALDRPPAERAALLTPLATPVSHYQAAFATYVRNSAGLPGEQALQREFATATKASSEYTVGLLTPETLTAAQVTQAMRYNAQMVRALAQLQSMYGAKARLATKAAEAAQSRARTLLLGSALIAFALVIGLAIWIVRSIRRESHSSSVQAARNELEAHLQRALSMAESEDDVYTVVASAITTAARPASVELLVADSSRAHLHQVVATDLKPCGRCPVGAPTSCPAAVLGQTQRFMHSSALDACPHLRGREGDPIAAICVPVVITGRPMGVLHATTDAHKPPSEDTQLALELIGRRAGERLTMLRAFARSEMQAHTDPLTGLLNRRSIEASAADLTESGDPYVVAYADLDHFKMLNDVHGHDAGDRALRLFARVLRDSIRPTDLPARYGGEEFLVVLPQCTPADAVTVMERVRTNLQAAIRDGGNPDFTVSVGIAPSAITSTFSEIAEQADHALLGAKAAGRNRIAVAGTPSLVEIPDDPSSLSEPPAR